MRRQSRLFFAYPALPLLINILIAGKLFFVEYSGWLCLCAVFGSQALLKNALLKNTPAVRWAAIAVLLLACAMQFRHDLNYAHPLIRSTDITHTPHYRIARWMQDNMRDRRVMIGGEYLFTFNDLTDVAQLQGGFETTEPNIVLRIAGYTLYAARDAGVSVLWLRAFGVSAICVPGPESPDFYKPFANPRKFDGVLPVLWRENDDTIYRVPARSDSLAHVIPEGTQVQRAPVTGLDVTEIERYVRALDDPALPEASFEWENRHTARIHAPVRPGQVVSAQVNYSPGWHARINGTPNGASQPVYRDGLGLILLRPACNGSCDITLSYGASPEWRATMVASIAVMAGVFFAAARKKRVPVTSSSSNRS